MPHLDNMVYLIKKLNAMGLKVKRGDLISPGTAVAVRVTDGTERSFKVIYYNLDPDRTVRVKVNYNSDGICCGRSSETCKFDDDDDR